MRSALDKTKISQTTWLSSTGFTGDEQAYKDHGGPHLITKVNIRFV
jgi:MOSC domain-containing protein YiiM